MKNRLFCLLLALIIPLVSFSQKTNDSLDVLKVKVYKFDIKQEIGPPVWRQTKDAFAEAKAWNADIFLIHMNTYGGAVVDADSIRTAILNSEKPVYVYIDNNAASAGALISIACDGIYMRTGANIGAATVVNQTGEAMPDKYQSYMRSTMRATAESHGKDTLIQNGDTIVKWKRDPLIAEAMVDPRTYIKNVIDTGKVLTFTPNEAIKNGYCEGIANSVEEVLKQLKVEDYVIKKYEPSGIEKLVDFMLNPMFQGLFIMLIIGGIYFELQSPGIGFPLIIAIIGAFLYFSPLYLEGLAANWEIILFIVGVALIGVEVFVIPGFGVAGVSGIVLIISGLSLSLIDNVNLEFEPRHIKALLGAILLVTFSMLSSIIISINLSKRLFAGKGYLGRLALKTEGKIEEGYIGVDMSPKSLVGQKGICGTDLRPSGKIIINEEIYDAKSEDGFINKGTEIIVLRYETGQVYVMKANNE
ncbi:nodulation protein NfeD [Ancylomarina sp. 16SWW S1-10-2]|uniref:NfeD family protein n=1 Tax=Ancylomarina sp. 16SWW S1-10-2 TaxID=2499681 RepID=UPI0012AEADED|nr:NfeD family protein [Ancylomarina sp. 16SWW S1-10-2]MRT93488.1 nodulation protein NfeD [Ancylomarina sp. 16SWW S1-10-2]